MAKWLQPPDVADFNKVKKKSGKNHNFDAMNPELEKMERLLEAFKNQNVSADNFLDELWFSGDMMTRPELHRIADEFNSYLLSKTPLQQADLALTKLVSGYVAYLESNFESCLLLEAEAQKIFTELKDERRYHYAGVLIGSGYRSIGEVEPALQYLYEAYQYLTKTNDAYNLL